MTEIDTQAAPAPLQVRVKELEWRTFCWASGNCLAETAIGEYVVQKEDHEWLVYLPDHDEHTGVGYENLGDARAAAQADYERRIFSALDLSTPPQIEALEETGETAIGQVPAGLERETASACDSADVSSQTFIAALEAEIVKLRGELEYIRSVAGESRIALVDQVNAAEAEVARLTEVVKAFLPYSNAEYVPNVLFANARAALKEKALAVARCCSAIVPCSWQRHNGMDSVCPTCQAAAGAALPPEQSAAQQPATDAVATHRHKKSGGDYVLIGIGKMQAEHWCDYDPHADEVSVDMREVAIYRGVSDGQYWVRPREEFDDGRFEALSQSPAKPAGDSLQQRPAAEEKRP